MGMTAENVATRCRVTREQQDECAVISQSRAVQAREGGQFDAEIVGVLVPAHGDVDKDGNEVDVPETVVRRDDGPRPGTTMEILAKLKAAFREDGTVTAGNEAFAAQIVPCKQELGIPDEKLNPFGGAIALGHPFGMSGARIMTTLFNGLQALDGTYGIESMCVAGGMGQAMLIERLA